MVLRVSCPSDKQTAQADLFLPGFVEGDGGVSMEAAHASRNTTVDGLTWIELPGTGRTVSGVTPWPRGGDDKNFTAGSGPSMYVLFLHVLCTRS